MNKLSEVMKFLRVIDVHDGQVSLTNVALIIVLVKLAIAPAIGLTEIGGLFIGLLSYQSKKVIRKSDSNEMESKVKEIQESVQTQQDDTAKKLDDAMSQLQALAMKVGLTAKR